MYNNMCIVIRHKYRLITFPFTPDPTFHLSQSTSDILMPINPLSRPLFAKGVPTKNFDIKSVHDLEVFVSQDKQVIELFICTYFVPKQFITLDIKFKEGLTCKHVVDSASTIMTTVDIVSLQLCSDSKVLVIPIHNNSMCLPYSVLLDLMCFIDIVCPLSIQYIEQFGNTGLGSQGICHS